MDQQLEVRAKALELAVEIGCAEIERTGESAYSTLWERVKEFEAWIKDGVAPENAGEPVAKRPMK